MTAQILSFLHRPATPQDWSAQELAEFYRVEAALIQAGLRVTSARGLTDEGEPWFVFCRAGDDDVIIHFARIDGRYVISAPAYCGTASGPDFRVLVQRVIERQPAQQPQPHGNLFLHPAALLVILVASALLKSGHAAEVTPAKAVADVTEEKSRGVTPVAASTPAAAATTAPGGWHETMLLAAIAAAITPLEQTEPVTIIVSASAQLAGFVDQPHERTTGPILLDLPRDNAAGAGSTTPTVPMLQAIAAPPSPDGATPSALTHIVYQPDAAPGTVAISAAVQTALTPVALPAPPDLSAFLVAPNPAIETHPLSLSSLSGISKADLDLLHMIGVSDTVQYTATLPLAFVTVLRTGVHASVTHASVSFLDTEHALLIDNATASGPIVAPATPATEPEAAAPVATTVATHADTTVATPAATTVATHADTTVATPAATTVATPAATTVATPADTTIAAPADTLAIVLATVVEQFQAASIHPVVVLSDHAAIFYDAGANLSAVKSITYDFGDGFSISLIGLPAELSHAGVHV